MPGIKLVSFVLVLALIAGWLPVTAFAYPFSVKTSGHGTQSLILIPGFASSGEVWKQTLAVYEKRYTCYTLTMAGFAGEPAQDKPTFDHWTKAVTDWIKEKHLIRPIIIGHSMGGAMAMAIASRQPEIASRIIVVDGLPCLAALSNPGFSSNPKNDCSALALQFNTMSDAGLKSMQEKNMPKLVADSSRISMLVDWSIKSDRKTFALMYCDFLNTDLRPEINKITCPVLVLLEAPFTGIKSQVESQFQGLKNGTIHYAGKGRHFIMYDDPIWYLAELASFLK